MNHENAIMERWLRIGPRELLDRTLVWNERQLRHALREFERHRHHKAHRPRPFGTATADTGARLACPDEISGSRRDGAVAGQ